MKFLKQSILLLAFCVLGLMAHAQNYVEVGTGTIQNTMPIYSYWNYSWSSLIYNHVDLGSAKTITKIGLNCINGPKTVTNQKLYVKLSPINVFATAAYEDPTNNGYTLVFEGNLTFQTGWNEIVLTTPIVYDGTNNLIIHMENRWGTSYGPIFLSTASTINNNKNCGNDVTFPGVGNSGYLNPYPSSLANMRFFYTGTGPATPTNPIPADNATRVSVGTTLSWTLGANTTSYDLYFGTSQQSMALVVSNAPATAGTNTYTPPALLQDSLKHYWKVVAKNGSQQESSPIWKFKTEVVIDEFPYNQGFEDSTVFNTYPVESAWTIVPDIMWYESTMAPHTGTLSAKSLFYNSYMYAILQSPKVLLPANHQISYYWKNSISKVAGHDSTFFEITSNGGQTWTTLDILSPSNPSTTYVQRTHNLTPYAGNNTFFRFRYKTDNSGSANAVYLDDISITSTAPAPSIQLSSNQIAFRELYVNGHTNEKLIVTNVGSANLIINSTSIGSPFACTYAGTLAPGQSDTLNISFNGNTAGTYSNNLTLNISGSFTGNNIIPITGIVLGDMLAFTEYFDASNQLPAHWNKIILSNDPAHDVTIVNAPSDAYSAPNAAKLFNAGDATSPLLFITPGVTNFASNSLTFYAKTTGTSAQNLQIGLMDDPYDATSFTLVQTVQLSQTYSQYSIAFNTSNTKPYIAFKHGNGIANIAIWIDDVVWDNPIPNNPPLPAIALYPAVGAAQVDIMMPNKYLIWTDGGGNPDGYKLSLGTNNPPTNLLNNVTLGDTVVFQIGNTLNFSTTYYWQITPYNANGSALNCPVWSFTTMADPTNNTFPFSQTFDALIPGSAFYYPPFMMGYVYPLGWSVQSPSNQLPSWTVIENSAGAPGNAHSAPNAMFMGANPSLSMDEWMFTPPMMLNIGYSYDVSFYYKSGQGGSPTSEKLEVFAMSTSQPGATGTQLFNNSFITTSEYESGEGSFIPQSAGIYYFAFHGYSNANQNKLFVDDVTIEKNLITTTNLQNTTKSVQISPNPCRDWMRIDAPEFIHAEMKIFDQTGRIILQNHGFNSTEKINVSSFAKGIYILQLTTNNQDAKVKFVVD